MKKLIILVGFTFLVACGGGGGSSSSGGGSPSSWVGSWLVQTENGVDISSLGVTYTITESSVAQVIPGVCAATLAVSVNGNLWSGTVVTTDCAGISPGTKQSGSFSVSGSQLTIVNNYWRTTQICVRISS